jgi:hypothetical protein
MDLTKSYPRSVHEKLFGVVQLARTVDKSRAAAQDTLGEYDYGCPMDQAIFGFLGIDKDALLNISKNASNIGEVEAYVKPFAEKKTEAEREQWSNEYVTHQPQGPSLEYFLKLRGEVAPDRTDVTSWPDLLDLDEKRTVPKRTATSA